MSSHARGSRAARKHGASPVVPQLSARLARPGTSRAEAVAAAGHAPLDEARTSLPGSCRSRSKILMATTSSSGLQFARHTCRRPSEPAG